MNLTSAVKTAKSVVTANSPVLLLGTTIAGVVTTGVLAARAGWNARGIVDDEQSRRYAETKGEVPYLTPQEIAQFTWKEFTLPTISAVGSIAAAIGTHTVHTKRANAMAALYAVTSNKLDDMTEQAEALLGPKKTQQLQNEVAQKTVDRDGLTSDAEVLMTDDGTELCYDEWSGRWFMSSMQKLESGINDVNRFLIDDGSASLNDYYDSIGLDHIPMGDSFGWSAKKIEAKFGSVIAPNGKAAISISFHKAPKESMGHP